MPLKVDKQALSQVCTTDGFKTASQRINTSLVGVISDSCGRILHCTHKATGLNVPRGTKVIQDLTTGRQKEILLRSFEENTHACVSLTLRKSCFITAEYISDGVFICYIFTDSKTITSSVTDELLHTSFAVEYVKRLQFSRMCDCSNSLICFLENKVSRLTVYNNACIYASTRLEVEETDLNVYLQLLINYINQFTDTLHLTLNYSSNRHANVLINNSMFAKIFCAAVCYMSCYSQADSIPVDIRLANNEYANVCIISYATSPLPSDNAYLYFIDQVTQSLGWNAELIFCQKDCQAQLNISLPLDNVSEDTIHNVPYYKQLSNYINQHELEQALLML